MESMTSHAKSHTFRSSRFMRLRRGTLLAAAVGLASAACAAAPSPHPGWSKYTIAVGAHSASVDQNGAPKAPIAGFTSVAGRSFDFIFDSTAKYTITAPTQPGDQLDYNKLPGFSNCVTTDLSQNGAMFGWRWRLDTSPKRLEIVHYANNNGTHLYPSAPLVSLTEAEVDGQSPLLYEVAIGGANNSKYLFHVQGTIGTRSINVFAEHPRQCPSTSPASTKWASGFYFGGTSTAPSEITGWMVEH